MHIVGIAQSLGLFFVACLATAAMLSLAMIALASMERATVPARTHQPAPSARSVRSARGLDPVNRSMPSPSSSPSADAVSSPGGCTFLPRR